MIDQPRETVSADRPVPDRVDERLSVMLVGAGVVGRAIATDHLRCDIEVWMVDQDEDQLRSSCDLVLKDCDATADSASPWGARVPLPIVHLYPSSTVELPLEDAQAAVPRWLLIESISERLEMKQAFFAEAETWFDRLPVLTTNTSTLPIGGIAASMRRPERLCGLHFFMPVVDRPAAEIIPHTSANGRSGDDAESTAEEVIEACCEHARRLGKTPIQVRDSPGFVVNRLLAPYLNLATSLLCGGVDARTIAAAARAYGMPISPLELIDLIGSRTAFDGGRVVWSAFPNRMDPSPLLPALVKNKLTGVAGGEGFYQYDEAGNRRSDELSPAVQRLVEKYHHEDFVNLPQGEDGRITLVADLFAASFRCEALAIQRDGVADSISIQHAMRGGLRWDPGRGDGPVEYLSTTRANELALHFPKLKSIQLPGHL